jgi:type II secretory pathway pseudopilin PulG
MKLFYMNRQRNKMNKGFTLIELMVASSIFIIVMLISSGAILAVFDANQKSKNLRSVMDNLNLSLESMTRTIRFGKNYHCGSSGSLSSPLDCGGSGQNSFTVLDVSNSQVTYSLVGGRILRTTGLSSYYMTSTDLTITNLAFRVYGSAPYSTPNYQQPQVIIVISGYVGIKATTKSTFTLETTISQRQFDFP